MAYLLLGSFYIFGYPVIT